MKLLLYIIILILLAIITYQDFTNRLISWIILPILFISGASIAIMNTSLIVVLTNSTYNFSFIGLQLLILTGFISLKERRLINITQKYLGWGDILFFVAIASLLPFASYFIFYLLSLFITILFILMLKAFNKFKDHIPLAGSMSIQLIFLLSVFLFIDESMLYNEDWIWYYF